MKVSLVRPLFCVILTSSLIASCTEPKPKEVVKSYPTGATKWTDEKPKNGEAEKKCQSQEWKTEWSDGSESLAWKGLGCRPMTDEEKAERELRLQAARNQPGISPEDFEYYGTPNSGTSPTSEIPYVSIPRSQSNSRFVTHTEMETFGAGTLSCYRIRTVYYSDGTSTRTPTTC
jgi:hypothetical protein